jgi:hypothetical protein
MTENVWVGVSTSPDRPVHFSTNAEYITRWHSTDRVIQIGFSNQKRLSGLIRNIAKFNMYIRYGQPRNLRATAPYICIPPGGNADMPPFFTGSIFAIWSAIDPIGYAVLHHYYHES